MLTALVSILSTISPSLTTPPATAQAKGQLLPPPGMVLIEGGSTKIGTTVKQAEEIGKSDSTLFGLVARETPQFEVRVEDFFLGVTEVTNEQYFAFVRATGARAPEHWAEKLIDAASDEFVREQGKEREKAKTEGRTPPEFRKFDRGAWWRKNWEGKPYSIPKGEETSPVVYVDYSEALAYSRWAGVRLMTELEFQRAGRGKTDQPFPWGTDMKDVSRAATQELRIDGREVKPSKPFKVGSLPLGRTSHGVYDLCGNVFEWTASPFSSYPGHKELSLTVGAGKQERKISGLTKWDANQRVVVSGSFQTPLFGARLTYRRGEERTQSTDSLGFRVAASVTPCADLAAAVMRDDMPVGNRPAGSQFDSTRVVAADRWTSSPGTATTVLEAGKPAVALPNYAIIENYDFVMFVPAVELDVTSVKGLADLAQTSGPVPVGILSLSQPAHFPALERGTYLVSFRGAGEIAAPVEAGAKGEKNPKDEKKSALTGAAQDPAKSEGDPVAVRLPEGLDPKQDTLIFYAPDGTPKSWMPVPNMEARTPVNTAVVITDAKRPVTVELPGGMRQNQQEDVTLVALTVNSYCRISNKSIAYTLPIYFKPGALGTGWRTR